MTIDSTWLRAFKEEAPHAFSPDPPPRVRAVFSDGQYRLMLWASDQGRPSTWDEYVNHAFAGPLRAFMRHADAVVLAFDNYAQVPLSKSMTQLKRRRNVPSILFNERTPLPCCVPSGVQWLASIANRTFKARLIEHIIDVLPQAILRGMPPSKHLVIDYKQPMRFSWNAELGRVDCAIVEGLAEMGEADVKFPRYADLYGALLVDSVDGDSVPIALLHHERRLSQSIEPPRVWIKRNEIKDPTRTIEKPKPAASNKRAKVDAPAASNERADVEKPSKKKAISRPEYLSIFQLYEALRSAVRQSVGRNSRLPEHDGHEIRMLVSLMCLTGTDFSRNMPYITGYYVFDNLPSIWMIVAMCYDAASDQLIPDLGKDRLVAMLYHLKYPRHSTSRVGMSQVHSELASSKISSRVKELIPAPARVESTVKNVNWVLRYWRCEGQFPDPLAGDFGYVRTAKGMAYADAVQ